MLCMSLLPRLASDLQCGGLHVTGDAKPTGVPDAVQGHRAGLGVSRRRLPGYSSPPHHCLIILIEMHVQKMELCKFEQPPALSMQ